MKNITLATLLCTYAVTRIPHMYCSGDIAQMAHALAFQILELDGENPYLDFIIEVNGCVQTFPSK